MIFDSHCHPQFPEYDQDRDEVIKRAQAAGVKMICVGTNLENSQQAIELAEKYPEDVWATAGMHPNDHDNDYDDDNDNDDDERIEGLRRLAKHPKVVAIGECGLDYYRIKNNDRVGHYIEIKEKQKELFLAQIKIAQELNKSLTIHCRPTKGTDDAYEDLVTIFQSSEGNLPKIVHFFVGGVETAKKLLDLGCYFTFGGVITFARDYDEVIRFLPLGNILLETDAPYVAPEPYRGKRNEPVYVIEVAKKLAEIKGLSIEAVINQTTKNTGQVFGIQLSY